MGSRLLRGAMAGLAAGVGTATLMTVMHVFTPDGNFVRLIDLVAAIVRSNSLLLGWLVHLSVSAVLGAIVGAAVAGSTPDPGSAAAWGAACGLAGWLVLLPIAWRLKPFVPGAADVPGQIAIAGLLTCLAYGALLGAIAAGLSRRPPASEARERFRRAA